MKIWITGAHGQLGQEFQLLSQDYAQYEWHFSTSNEADISKHEEIKTLFAQINPDILINCAAYTKVDLAETEPEKCNEINTDAAAHLAQLCAQKNATFIHFSTDYVFNGKSKNEYKERDRTGPLNVYGASKANAEKQILASNTQGIILRTSWVFSQFGHNFLKTMLHLGKERESLNIINDQISCPTHAADLAKAVLELIALEKANKPIYLLHFSNSGVASWYDFAEYIFEKTNIQCQVLPIETEEYSMPAKRPKFSLLDTTKYQTITNKTPQHWKRAVDECINLLNK